MRLRLGERGAEPDGDVDRDEAARIVDRAVHEDGRDHRRVGNEDASPLVGREGRVAQGDLVDDARVVLDRDPVAEAHGLREREEDARAEVAERRREREAGDDGEHRARGEEGARDLLRRGKRGQDAPGADERDERNDDAEEEAERRAPTGGDCRIPLGQPALIAIEGIPEREAHSDQHGHPDEGGDERLCEVAVHAAEFGARRGLPALPTPRRGPWPWPPRTPRRSARPSRAGPRARGEPRRHRSVAGSTARRLAAPERSRRCSSHQSTRAPTCRRGRSGPARRGTRSALRLRVSSIQVAPSATRIGDDERAA